MKYKEGIRRNRPKGLIYKRAPITQRFEDNIYYGLDGCWYWIGHLSFCGYGKIRMPGRNGKMVFAHRLSYQINKGEIPEGYLVCHSCDNPMCVNPDHLFIGTHKDNTQDMLKKNRGRFKRMDNL